MSKDPYQIKKLLTTKNNTFSYYSLAELNKQEHNIHKLPFSIRILKEQFIDELWLTLEPKIFGTGGNFVTDVKLDINLSLIHYEKVNEQGTLITKYAVLKK